MKNLQPGFISDTVNVLKYPSPFCFCSQIKCWFSGLEFTTWMSEWQKGTTLIRLLFQKLPVLGLHCFSRQFWQATSVQNFRTFTICVSYLLVKTMGW